MVGTLYLIRHGRTEGDGKRRYKGSLDVPLSAQGEAEMERAAEFVRASLEENGKRLGAVYCSGLKRAARSAEIVAAPFGLKPTVVGDLRERHFGLWEGLAFEEIAERWPDAFTAWASDPLNHSPLEGESTLEVSRRVERAFGDILERHDGEAIAVVAHGGVNRAILCRLMGVPLQNIFRLEQDHGAVSVVEFYDGYPVVKLLNWRSPI
ncbi:MAG: histidine phosphatase family protein [Nitrospirota bacterium]|jgi:alpha-ribazole phosphatase